MLHNFRPEPAARLGLDYETFRAVNPRLVYCATYGFRARGPYGNKPAYDDVIQAASGLAALQASIAGEPRYVPTIVADKTSSLTVLSSVLAGLFERERSGQGQAIEVPMMESVVAYVMVEHLYGETFIPPLESAGYKRILNRWRRPFQTKDGHLAVVPYTDAHWRTFFQLAGRPDLQDDPRFATLESRLANIEVLYEELGKIVATRTSAEWLQALERASVPATVVNTLESLLTDPAARGDRLLESGRASERGHAAHAGHPGDVQPDARRDPAPPAAPGRAQRRGAARGRVQPGGDRRHARLGRHGAGAMKAPERLALSRDIVGVTVGPIAHDIDARWLMAYAAGLGETDPRYYDTLAPGGPAAHPLFPVCYEWPAMLALRDRDYPGGDRRSAASTPPTT